MVGWSARVLDQLSCLKEAPKTGFPIIVSTITVPTLSDSCTFTPSLATLPVMMFLRELSDEKSMHARWKFFFDFFPNQHDHVRSFIVLLLLLCVAPCLCEIIEFMHGIVVLRCRHGPQSAHFFCHSTAMCQAS